ISRDTPAVAGFGRPRGAAGGTEIPGGCRCDLRHRLLVHRNLVRHRHAEGQNHHSFDARSKPSQQGRRGENRPGRRCRPGARCLAGGDRQERHVGPRLAGGTGKRFPSARDARGVAAEIAASHKEWLAKWMPKLTHNEAPLSPYRVLWDLQHTVDINNTIITHDAGSPRDQLSPFWNAVEPLSYIGWGKTTQLGYGLGLAMGAKLAKPDKLCINVWGDAAIGFTGMDFETAVRERIPIMSILLNNFSMA